MFQNRKDAGEKLSRNLMKYKNDDAIVLGIPRGGIAVAEKISSMLHKPLNVSVSKKIGAPFNKEIAIGALAEDGSLYLNNQIIKHFEISDSYIQEESKKQEKEIKRRIKLYRGDNKFPDINGKTVIIVDDGIATGYTIMASIYSLKKCNAKKIVVAAPTASKEVVNMLKSYCDEVVVLEIPDPFISVASSYMEFQQGTDDEVINLFKQFDNKKFI